MQCRDSTDWRTEWASGLAGGRLKFWQQADNRSAVSTSTCFACRAPEWASSRHPSSSGRRNRQLIWCATANLCEPTVLFESDEIIKIWFEMKYLQNIIRVFFPILWFTIYLHPISMLLYSSVFYSFVLNRPLRYTFILFLWIFSFLLYSFIPNRLLRF